MDFFKHLAIDSNKANDGVAITYPGTKGEGKVDFMIARNSNRAAKRELASLLKAKRADLDALEKAEDEEGIEQFWREVTIEVMAKHILKGWTGPVQFDGEDLPFSIDNAKRLLGLEEFRNWVDSQSGNTKAYRLHAEEDQKN